MSAHLPLPGDIAIVKRRHSLNAIVLARDPGYMYSTYITLIGRQDLMLVISVCRFLKPVEQFAYVMFVSQKSNQFGGVRYKELEKFNDQHL